MESHNFLRTPRNRIWVCFTLAVSLTLSVSEYSWEPSSGFLQYVLTILQFPFAFLESFLLSYYFLAGSIGRLAKGLRWDVNEQSAVLVSTSPWKNLGFISLHLKKVGLGKCFFIWLVCFIILTLCFGSQGLVIVFLQSIPQGTMVF